MRQRQLKWLWKRLKELQGMKLRREALLMKLGAARQHGPRVWRLVEIEVDATQATFTYRLKRDRLWQVRRRAGRCLLRSNLTETDPAVVWNYYLQLVQVEQAFGNLKGDLALRPIFHQNPSRIEAHLFGLLLVPILFSCADSGCTGIQVLETQTLGSHTKPQSHKGGKPFLHRSSS